MTNTTWREEFEKAFPFEIVPIMEAVDTEFGGDCVQVGEEGNFTRVPDALHICDFIQQQINKAEERIIREHIKLADKMEIGHETEIHEWRAFKGFRNALNDRLNSISNIPTNAQ